MNNTVLKSIDILELISNSEKSLTVTEISNILKIPKTTVFNIIAAFLNKEIVEIDCLSKKNYKLGIKSYELGVNYLNKLDLYKLSAIYLKDLSAKTNQTAFLCKKINNKVVYIDKVEPNTIIRTSVSPGQELDLFISSPGRAILSTYKDEDLKNYLKDISITKETKNTITDKTLLIKKLKEAYENGFYISDCEYEENIFCMSAPIFDHTQKAIGAIGISTISSNINSQIISESSTFLVEISKKISLKLGYINNFL